MVFVKQDIQYDTDIEGVIKMKFEEYIKDGFDNSLRDYIQSEEYRNQKQ